MQKSSDSCGRVGLLFDEKWLRNNVNMVHPAAVWYYKTNEL